MPGERSMSPMRQNSQSSLGVDDIAVARMIAREMDAEDKRAKIAARSGGQDGGGGGGTLVAPMTNLGRGLSRGNPRHGSPKRPINNNNYGNSYSNNNRSEALDAVSGHSAGTRSVASTTRHNSRARSPNRQFNNSYDGGMNSYGVMMNSYDGLDASANSLPNTTTPYGRSNAVPSSGASVASSYTAPAPLAATSLGRGTTTSTVTSAPGLRRAATTTATATATGSPRSPNNGNNYNRQRRGLAGKRGVGRNNSPTRPSNSSSLTGAPPLPSFEQTKSRGLSNGKPNSINSRAISGGSVASNASSVSVGPYYYPGSIPKPNANNSRAISGGSVLSSGGGGRGGSVLDEGFEDRSIPEGLDLHMNMFNEPENNNAATYYSNNNSSGNNFGASTATVPASNLGGSYSSVNNNNNNPAGTTNNRRISVVPTTEPAQRATTTTAANSLTSSLTGGITPFGSSGGTLERGSIVADDIAKHMSMDVSGLSVDSSFMSHYHRQPQHNRNKPSRGGGGMDTSSVTSDNMDSSAYSNCSRKGEDPGMTKPLEYRNSKGLSKPNPANMTRLEPVTTLGGGYSTVNNNTNGSRGHKLSIVAATEPGGGGRAPHINNSVADDRSVVSTTSSINSRGGHDYRDSKGLARPPPGATMTRLEPTTSGASSAAASGGCTNPTHHSRGISMGSTASNCIRSESIPEDTAANMSSMVDPSRMNNPAADDNSTVRGADRNEMRRLKFGLSNSPNSPATIVTPVIPSRDAYKDEKEGEMSMYGLKASDASLKTGRSFHQGGTSTTRVVGPNSTNSSKASLNVGSTHSAGTTSTTTNPALAPSAPALYGPGAYRVEHQQQSSSSSGMVTTADVHTSSNHHHPSQRFSGIDEETGSIGSSQKKELKLSRGSKLFVAFGCIFLLVGIVVAVLLTSGGGGGGDDVASAQDEGDDDSLSPTMSPSAPSRPPGMDMEDYLWSLLPETTTQAIIQDVNGSQAMAIDWMLQDPSVTEYTNPRLLQRFSLVTLYLEAGGTQWEHQGHWLSYDHHECTWMKERACPDGDKEKGEYTMDAKIRQLKLIESNVQGNLPPEISLLTHLEVLDLSDNDMQGSIPSQVGLMTRLTELALDANHFIGSIPPEIGQLTKMARLYLNDNKLTGSLPSPIGALVELKDLFLYNNKMTKGLPTTIGHLTNLNRLYLQENYFTGPLPSEVGNLINMVHFQLDRNRLNGILPSELSQMAPKLRILTLSNNTFTGTIPTFLATFSSLTDLDLENNTFAGGIPPELPPNVEVLNLGRSGVSGTLPSELGLLTKLNELYLYKNIELTGTIPTELGLCTDMKFLEVDFNKLSGTIPTQLGSMTNLEHLWLYLNNYLSGPIPSEIGQCTRLKYLFLDRNRFSGPLPSELANLRSLIQVNISNTALTGTFPQALCDGSPDISQASFDCGEVCGCGCPCNR